MNSMCEVLYESTIENMSSLEDVFRSVVLLILDLDFLERRQ